MSQNSTRYDEWQLQVMMKQSFVHVSAACTLWEQGETQACAWRQTFQKELQRHKNQRPHCFAESAATEYANNCLSCGLPADRQDGQGKNWDRKKA